MYSCIIITIIMVNSQISDHFNIISSNSYPAYGMVLNLPRKIDVF